MLQVGDIVKFFDYDRARYGLAHDDNGWRIGIVAEIRTQPWDRDWDPKCCPYPVIVYNGHSQPIVMPNKHNIGTWVHIVSKV